MENDNKKRSGLHRKLGVDIVRSLGCSAVREIQARKVNRSNSPLVAHVGQRSFDFYEPVAGNIEVGAHPIHGQGVRILGLEVFVQFTFGYALQVGVACVRTIVLLSAPFRVSCTETFLALILTFRCCSHRFGMLRTPLLKIGAALLRMLCAPSSHLSTGGLIQLLAVARTPSPFVVFGAFGIGSAPAPHVLGLFGPALFGNHAT